MLIRTRGSSGQRMKKPTRQMWAYGPSRKIEPPILFTRRTTDRLGDLCQRLFGRVLLAVDDVIEPNRRHAARRGNFDLLSRIGLEP